MQQLIKTIQAELGGNVSDNDVQELREKAKLKQWSPKVEEVFQRELKKLERLPLQSPDYSVQIQYLQTIVKLPWENYSKVKERILEHLAVLKLKGNMKAPILCLYGPPGVGKTSLGRSIADALHRQYVRISLGGLHDEAEIRGHRRPYIRAM